MKDVNKDVKFLISLF